MASVSYAFAYSFAQNAVGSTVFDFESVAHDAGSAAGAASAVGTAVVEAVAAGRSAANVPPDLLEGPGIEGFAYLLREAYDNRARTYEVIYVSRVQYEQPDEPMLSPATFDVTLLETGTKLREVNLTVEKHVEVSNDGASGTTWFRVSSLALGEAFDPVD